MNNLPLDITIINVFIISLILSLILTPLIKIACLKLRIIDTPNHRSMHHSPIAKGGGIAIYLAFIITIIYFLVIKNTQFIWIIIGGTIIILLGFIDDIHNIRYSLKLLGQFIVAMLLITFGGFKVGFIPTIFYLPLLMFGIIGMINAINLMDGMDGMASGISAIFALFFMLIAITKGSFETAVLSAALCGSCIGFLKYNFHPAKIFMGDSGSLFIGFILALLSIKTMSHAQNILQLFIPVVILTVPISDTAFAIIRRVWQKKSIFDADSDHFYEWLWKNRIFGYKTIVLMTYFICVVFGILSLWVYFI